MGFINKKVDGVQKCVFSIIQRWQTNKKNVLNVSRLKFVGILKLVAVLIDFNIRSKVFTALGVV